jgi:hypothetical protein
VHENMGKVRRGRKGLAGEISILVAKTADFVSGGYDFCLKSHYSNS